MDVKEEIEKKRKDGWIEVWFAIEAVAANSEVVKKAMENHINKLSRVQDVFIYEKKIHPPEKMKNPPSGINEAYTQAVDINLFIKDVYTLLNVIIVYGPSAVEIIGPKSREMRIDELQSIVNTLAGVVHEFAARGIGGIVISTEPDKKGSQTCP